MCTFCYTNISLCACTCSKVLFSTLTMGIPGCLVAKWRPHSHVLMKHQATTGIIIAIFIYQVQSARSTNIIIVMVSSSTKMFVKKLWPVMSDFKLRASKEHAAPAE
jgi:hypothetical protein